MKKRICVTAKDIAKGKRVDANSCPVALALKRALGYLCPVTRSYWRNGDDEVPTSDKVHEFVRKFDQGIAVKPFSFYVEVPGELQEAQP